MKILSIGNSFSQDAHKWIHKLAKTNGIDIQTANLFIPACSLQIHWNNIMEDNANYDLEWNGNEGERKISISEALQMEAWDVITLQQVSSLSGFAETYEPYLSKVAETVRNTVPDAKLYFHQTWAYEIDCTHEAFGTYGGNQKQMYNIVTETMKRAAESIHVDMIPVGSVVQTIRSQIPEFDYANGGISLCRDGCHLSYDYGRYVAAATWIHTLTGQDIKVTDFEDLDKTLLGKICKVVNRHLSYKEI